MDGKHSKLNTQYKTPDLPLNMLLLRFPKLSKWKIYFIIGKAKTNKQKTWIHLTPFL